MAGEHRFGREVLGYHVGPFDQPHGDLACLGRRKVKREAVLADVEIAIIKVTWREQALALIDHERLRLLSP